MDIYREVTDRIISQLENGTIPWKKPWIVCGGVVSHVTGKSYSLLNQMLLDEPGEYLTFAQCQKEGGNVKKGAKSQIVLFWKFIEQEDEETHEKKRIPLLRYYNVFHLSQCEGLKPRHRQPLLSAASPDETAESMISAYVRQSGVKLIHERSDRAYYQSSTDCVILPCMEQFAETAEYCSTAFHELTHSTGHASRLNRLTAIAHFANEEYSKEELIAEIGAAALVNAAGLETSGSFQNSTAYIQNWIKVMRNDKRFIISAAGKAEKAVNLILGQGLICQ